MSRKKITINLSRADVDQLRHYILERDREGFYYGNREQFEKRHKHLIDEICRVAESFPDVEGSGVLGKVK